METIRIKINDFYGNPSYYSVMPESIFNEMERASLQGEEFVVVSKSQYNEMIESYKKKMECKD